MDTEKNELEPVTTSVEAPVERAEGETPVPAEVSAAPGEETSGIPAQPEEPATPPGLVETDLPLTRVGRINDRDIYDLGEFYLSVFTDRVSVFGGEMPTGILDKGCYSADISAYWLSRTRPLIANNFKKLIKDVSELDEYIAEDKRFEYPQYLAGRSMVLRKAEPIPVKFEAWGYLTGPAWKEYKDHGTAFGQIIINGLLESQSIPGQVIVINQKMEDGSLKRTTKDELIELVGAKHGNEIYQKTTEVYDYAQRYSRIPSNLFVANMKVEFGLINNKPAIISDLLSPDTACYWDINSYRVGRTHYSYELQSLKAWLLQTTWNKTRPFPNVPPEIIEQSIKRYQTISERLSKNK